MIPLGNDNIALGGHLESLVSILWTWGSQPGLWLPYTWLRTSIPARNMLGKLSVAVNRVDSGVRVKRVRESTALLVTACVTLGKLPNLSVPLIPHLWNQHNNNTYFKRSLTLKTKRDFPGGPVVQTPNAGGMDSVPGPGTNIPHAARRGHKKKKKNHWHYQVR